MRTDPHQWCASCQSDGIATPADYRCESCQRWRCDAHVLTDPHYVPPPPPDTETLDLFQPDPEVL